MILFSLFSYSLTTEMGGASKQGRGTVLGHLSRSSTSFGFAFTFDNIFLLCIIIIHSFNLSCTSRQIVGQNRKAQSSSHPSFGIQPKIQTLIYCYFHPWIFLHLELNLLCAYSVIQFKKMIESLPSHRKDLYSNIIFNNNETQALLAVRNLDNPEDIANLKHIYDQKIAFEATYVPIKPPKAENNDPDSVEPSRIPSIVGTLFFCCFPEDNRELFDITNEIFLKRFFAVFLFWKKNFLAIGGGEADLFGPLWITLSYVAIMGFMGNFTVYLVDAISFKFMENRYANTFGTVAIFTIAEIIFYPSILHCLGGFMLTKDAVCIIGYSLVLYFVPTMLCMFTSLAWYVTCLFGEGIIRAIFLFRNFSTRIESRTYILLIVFLLVEFLYAYVLLQVVFFKHQSTLRHCHHRQLHYLTHATNGPYN